MSITARTNYLGNAGLVQSISQGSWDYLYRTSTVRDSKWNIGDRVVLPDGRVFRYAKATNAMPTCKFGVKFYGQIGDGLAVSMAINHAIGERDIVLTAAGVTKDEFSGGYMMIHVGTHQQFRGVVGNTATNGVGTVTFTLDAGLSVACTTQWTEVLQSPYANVKLTAGPSGGLSGDDYSSVAGIPNVITAAANQYVWLQTWGPIWINPHGASLQDAGITGGERKLVFDVEGSVCIEDDVAHGPGADGDEHQIAGFIIDRSASGTSGPPLVMLQISP
jgi:hypothetical protein